MLFNIYISSISDVFTAAGHDDDNTGYHVFTITAASEVLNDHVPQCIHLIKNWMATNFLKV